MLVCGMTVKAVAQVVPIELEGVRCACGGKHFRFVINYIMSSGGANPTDWWFELAVICIGCNRKKFVERVLSFFKLKRIKVGPTGSDVQMK